MSRAERRNQQKKAVAYAMSLQRRHRLAVEDRDMEAVARIEEEMKALLGGKPGPVLAEGFQARYERLMREKTEGSEDCET